MSLALNTVVANEEARIVGLLEHAAGFCDELVVVVDEKSRDDTYALAYEFGATVVVGPHSPWCEPLRPLAAEHTRGDWILVLDADERVNPEHLVELQAIPRERWLSANLPRANFVGGVPFRAKNPDRHVRWFKKGAVEYALRPHGYIRPFDASRCYQPETLAWILHEKTEREHDLDEMRAMRIERDFPRSEWGVG